MIKQICFAFIAIFIQFSLKAQHLPLVVEGNAPRLHIIHTCSGSETVKSLSIFYNVSVDSITIINDLSSTLTKGVKIKIPVYSSNFSADSSGALTTEQRIPLLHLVQPKEGLWRISVNHFKVPVDKIRTWNQLQSDALQPNQLIKVGYLKMNKGNSSNVTTTNTTVSQKVTAPVQNNVVKPSSQKGKIDTIFGKAKSPYPPSVKKFSENKTATTKVKKDETISPIVSTKKVTIVTTIPKNNPVTKSNVNKDSVPRIVRNEYPDTTTKVSVAVAPISGKTAIASSSASANAKLINKTNFLIRFAYISARFTGVNAISNSYLTDKNPNYKAFHTGGSNQRSGIALGVGTQNRLGKIFFLQTEFQYEQKGGSFKIDSIVDPKETTNGRITTKVNYLSFTLLPGLHFVRKTSIFFYGGIYGSYLLNAVMSGRVSLSSLPGQAISLNNNENRRFSKSDLGYAAGLELKLPYLRTKRQHFVIDLRYTNSFNSVGNRVVNGKTEQLLNQTYQVGVAYEFNR